MTGVKVTVEIRDGAEPPLLSVDVDDRRLTADSNMERLAIRDACRSAVEHLERFLAAL